MWRIHIIITFLSESAECGSISVYNHVFLLTWSCISEQSADPFRNWNLPDFLTVSLAVLLAPHSGSLVNLSQLLQAKYGMLISMHHLQRRQSNLCTVKWRLFHFVFQFCSNCDLNENAWAFTHLPRWAFLKSFFTNDVFLWCQISGPYVKPFSR